MQLIVIMIYSINILLSPKVEFYTFINNKVKADISVLVLR